MKFNLSKLNILVLVNTIILITWCQNIFCKEITIEKDISWPCDEGNRYLWLTFNDNGIKKELVEKYLIVHPEFYNDEYCELPIFPPCSENGVFKKPDSKPMIVSDSCILEASNAINEGEKRIIYLRNLKGIPELQPLVNDFIKSMEFSLKLDKTILEYLKTGNINVLEQQPNKKHSVRLDKVIKDIQRASSLEEKCSLVTTHYHNAVIRLKDENINREYIWKIFLKKYGIKEYHSECNIGYGAGD